MTWAARDLPVLEGIVDLTEKGVHLIEPHRLAEHLGMELLHVQRALAALAGEYPPFFEFTDETDFDTGAREIEIVHSPTGAARRAVGVWPPTPDVLADRIVAGLEAAAASEGDQEKRGRLKAAAAYLGGAGRDLLVEIAGAAVGKAMGL